MSYILDALKKSENERDREQGGIPDIQTIHNPLTGAARESSNVWPYIAAITALFAVLVVALVWKPSDSVNVTQESELPDKEVLEQLNNIATKEDVRRDSPIDNQQTTGGADDSSKSNKQQTKVQKKQITEKQAKTKVKPKQQVIFATEPLDSSSEPVPNNRSTKNQFNSATVYKVAELPMSVRKNVPPITFSGHVYSSTPGNRSVMINGSKMREGQSVTSQLTLKEITPDGAIFKFNGYVFSLSALQDWKFK